MSLREFRDLPVQFLEGVYRGRIYVCVLIEGECACVANVCVVLSNFEKNSYTYYFSKKIF